MTSSVKQIEEKIRKFALKNALDFGKANPNAVLGKILAEEPSLKSEMWTTRETVERVVGEVNGLGREKIASEFEKYEDEFAKREKETAEKSASPKMELAGAASGKFETRVPPEPGGYIHIGNAKQAILSQEFAKIYNGKIFLYFDDSNPEKCRQEYVEAIRKDYEWLGLKFDGEYYASDYILKLYELIRGLIIRRKAYVCNCSLERMKEYRFSGKECEHRKKGEKENLAKFEEMLAGKVADGAAILRYRGDMKSLNTTMRDPVLARVKHLSHYRLGDKYSVWPTYDMTTPVIDSLRGMTDTIRDANWNELRGELDRSILEDLGLRVYRIHLEGRFKIEGNTTSKREVRKLIKDGVIGSWDDPRLVTIRALRRRGIRPEAIRSFVLRFGMSVASATVNESMLLAENKKLIDPIAKHLFFVADPVKLIVNDAHETKVKLRLHPANERDFREYSTGTTFYISKEDASAIKTGEFVGLKDLMTVVVASKGKDAIQADAATTTTQRDKILQWVSEGSYIDCTVLVPEAPIDKDGNPAKDSLKTASGYVEKYASALKPHDIVHSRGSATACSTIKSKMQFIFISK